MRLNTNGAVDSSFGTFGAIANTVDSGEALADAMVIQPDGKILLIGEALVGPGVDFALMRFNTNGALDTSFGTNGKVTTAIGAIGDSAMAVALQADGKIIVAGSTIMLGHPEFVAVRYSTNGTLDHAYGADGNAFVNFNDNADNTPYGLALDSLGRAVVVGDVGDLFGVVRFQGDPYSLKILSITRLPNGHALLTGVGVPNGSHTLLGSTNLISGSFSAIGSVTADGSGHWQYEDVSATNFPSRFYRLSYP